MATYIDQNGERQQIDLNGTSLYREAADKRISFRQLVNQKFPTESGREETFKQMCVASGLRFEADENTGIPAANLRDIFDPAPEAAGGSFTNQPQLPDSRILFPAALMSVIENKLDSKEDQATGAFESLVGLRQSVAGNRIEQPVLNYSGSKGPEDSQFQPISQNTSPQLMLSLTASDISRKIPTTSIGMEVSYEALASNSISVVALSMARFFKMANYNAWTTEIGLLLSGNPDGQSTAMSNDTAALASVTAASFDATIVAAGVVTQKAWMAFLHSNSMKMTKTHFLCSYDVAYALDSRSGRPTNVMNNATDRMDVPIRLAWPAFQSTIDCIIMPAGTFPANTIMAIDKDYAIAKVTSTTASYEAIENLIMKRSQVIRVDRGFLTHRLFADAFNVMTLTV